MVRHGEASQNSARGGGGETAVKRNGREEPRDVGVFGANEAGYMDDQENKSTQLKRKKYPALLAWRRQGDLLSGYFLCYTADPAFSKDLLAFWEDNKEAVAEVSFICAWWHLKFLPQGHYPMAQSYIENVAAFAAKWRLDHLAGYRGRDAIMGWCWIKNRSPRITVDSFVTAGSGCGGMIPSVGEKVWGEYPLKNPITGEEVMFKGYDIRLPSVKIEIDSWWDAERESPAVVYDRLIEDCRTQIVEQLSHWCREYEVAGYQFPDKADKTQEHIEWLYQRVVYRKTCDAIAAHTERDDGYSKDYIQRITKELADEVEVCIPRPLRSRYR